MRTEEKRRSQFGSTSCSLLEHVQARDARTRPTCRWAGGNDQAGWVPSPRKSSLVRGRPCKGHRHLAKCGSGRDSARGSGEASQGQLGN